MKDNHVKAVESYINGNVKEFKDYLRGLSKANLLECLEVFIDYGYSLNKMKWLLER